MTVEQYLNTIPEENKNLFLEVRNCVLETTPLLEEAIKWKNCLTYVYKGKNLIQTVLGKNKVSLIFHNGAKIKDVDGFLEGDGSKVRTYRINTESFDEKMLANYVSLAIKAFDS